MKSRALRLTLLVLFVGLLAGAAYLVWNEETQSRSTAAAATAFDDRVRALSRLMQDIKSAQPGYVAAGQGEDFWTARVGGLLISVRDQLAALRSGARSSETRSEIETAASMLEDFEQMDRRARDYVRGGQRLLASDLVFTEGIEKIDSAIAALDRARDGEIAAGDVAMREHRRSQILAITGAAALGLLIAFALVPLPHEERPAVVTGRAERDQPAASVTLRHSVAPPPEPRPAEIALPPASPPPAPAPPAPRAAAAPAVDLPGIAALCADLSRVLDTRALPGALERAAGLLDASGVVVWIADPDGRELTPVVSHGYPEHLLARMGTIHREAQNVTAAAFRTGLVQTVKSDDVSHGAIAAPLLTPGGPVGVMAAELLHDAERLDATRAVATIVAAQLATLMGPPASRTGAKSEAVL